MIKSIKLSDTPDKLTPKKEKELENLKNRPIVNDEDMPNWENFTVIRGVNYFKSKIKI